MSTDPTASSESGTPTFRDEWEAMTAEQRRSYADPAKKCIEKGCIEPAGTPWGPYFCADHDDQRINRISKSLAAIARELA